MKTLMLTLAVAIAASSGPIGAQDWTKEVIAPAPVVVPQSLPFPDTDYSDLAAPELVTRLGVAARTNRQLALIARGRAASPEVRAHAERVLAEQTALDQQLDKLAKGTKTTLPTALDLANQQTVDRMMFLLGPQFDSEYLKVSEQAYSDQINLLQSARNLGNPVIAAFADTQLPTMIAYRDAVTSSTATAQTDED